MNEQVLSLIKEIAWPFPVAYRFSFAASIPCARTLTGF